MNRLFSHRSLARPALLAAALLLCSDPSYGDDLNPAPWPRDGATNYSTAAEWEFFTDASPSPLDADGVEVPLVIGDGLFGLPPQVLPSGDIAWTVYDGDGAWLGGANGIGPGALNFRVGNWIDNEPLKIVWMQMTYDPGPAGLSPFIEFILPIDPLPITGVALTGVTDGPIPGDALGRWHRTEVWEITPNPDFESIQVIVPEGVLVDQVVIDTISTVPEPGTLALLAISGLAMARRRR